MSPRSRQARRGSLCATARVAGARRRSLPGLPARLVVPVLLLAAALLGTAAPAQAHTNLLFTAPAVGASVPAAPESLTLMFDEPVAPGTAQAKVTGPAGPVEAGQDGLSHENRTLEVRLGPGQGPGVYTVSWQVGAADGDVMDGTFRYAVGAAVFGEASAQSGQPGQWWTAALRWLVFAALALAAGEAAAPILLRGRDPHARAPRRLARPAAVAGALAAAALALLVQAGSLSALAPPAWLALAPPAWLALAEAGGFLAAAALGPRRAALLPLAVVVGAEALRAHPQLIDAAEGIPLTAVHLGAAALWSGLLVHTLRTAHANRSAPGGVRAAFAAYARPAAWLFALTVLAGIASVMLVATPESVATTDYGRTLIVKAALVGLVAVLALAGRRLLRRPRAALALVRPARAEAAVLGVVLAASAMLTVLVAPATADAPLPIAPPPTGPVVPAAALAGSTGLYAQASAGQLVVQASEPDTGQGPSSSLRLEGTLHAPDGHDAPLRFRRCGDGCFVAPADWTEGTSTVTLRPAGPGQDPAPAAVSVAWPAAPAEDLLAKAAAATRGAGALTLYESVTSDPGSGLGEPRSFATTGQDLVSRALYASGKASIALRLPDADGSTRILAAYPAEQATVELTLAPDGRILHETQTAPHHISTRTLVYHDHEGEGA